MALQDRDYWKEKHGKEPDKNKLRKAQKKLNKLDFFKKKKNTVWGLLLKTGLLLSSVVLIIETISRIKS